MQAGSRKWCSVFSQSPSTSGSSVAIGEKSAIRRPDGQLRVGLESRHDGPRFFSAAFAHGGEAGSHFAAKFGFGHGAITGRAPLTGKCRKPLRPLPRAKRLVFSDRGQSFQAQPQAPRRKSRNRRKPNGNARPGCRTPQRGRWASSPKPGWQQRNFFTEVLIPSLFEPRSGNQAVADFSQAQEGRDRSYLDRATRLFSSRRGTIISSSIQTGPSG